MLIDAAISGDRNVIRKEAEDTVKYRPHNRNRAHAECKNKSNTNNNSGNSNHLKIIQKIHEPHTKRAQNKRTTGNIHIGHRTHIS